MNRARRIVLAVNIAAEKGQKKHNVGSSVVTENFGLQDDAHSGEGIRQVSFLAKESIDAMRMKGVDVDCGDFAENLTTEGIHLPSLPVGARLKIGDGVLLEVTQIGKVCHNRCSIFYSVGDCVMPREGIFAKVLKSGTIKTGDAITREQ